MKKIVLALAVVFSVALVSCGNSNKNAEDTTVDTPTTEEVVAAEVDTLVDSANDTTDTTVVEAAEVVEAEVK